ncbi:MAG: hypothetical protein HOI95_13485 [Chromatiales bacterium]|nr:hypothetical protein [Chromatiales bacterium]
MKAAPLEGRCAAPICWFLVLRHRRNGGHVTLTVLAMWRIVHCINWCAAPLAIEASSELSRGRFLALYMTLNFLLLALVIRWL